jgi:hypothetical protein
MTPALLRQDGPPPGRGDAAPSRKATVARRSFSECGRFNPTESGFFLLSSAFSVVRCCCWNDRCFTRLCDAGPSRPEMRQMRGAQTRRSCRCPRARRAMLRVQRSGVARPSRAAPRCEHRAVCDADRVGAETYFPSYGSDSAPIRRPFRRPSGRLVVNADGGLATINAELAEPAGKGVVRLQADFFQSG